MKKIVGVLFAVITIFVSVCYAQGGNTLEGLEKRVDRLEGQTDLFEKESQFLKEHLNSKFDNKSKAIDLAIKEKEDKLKNDYQYIKFVVWIFGSVTFIGLIIGIITLYFKIYKVAAQKVDEKFETLFNENRDKLVQLIKNQDKEFQLKQKKAVMVVSGDDTDDWFLKNFFSKMGFRKVRFERLQPDMPDIDVDLVLFNDEDGALSDGSILTVMSKTSVHTIGFYFGSKRIDFTSDYKDRSSFANTKMQLYCNLMNALRLQEILR